MFFFFLFFFFLLEGNFIHFCGAAGIGRTKERSESWLVNGLGKPAAWYVGSVINKQMNSVVSILLKCQPLLLLF